MSIPDFQTLMLPTLKLLADGKEHRARDIVDQLADLYKLTAEERAALLPSGQAGLFDNRVGWTRTYLKKSGLITSPRRAIHVITDLGRKVLAEKPTRIDMKFLERFPAYQTFRELGRNKAESTPAIEDDDKPASGQTPIELLENGAATMRAALAQDLLDRVHTMTWRSFEKLVVDLLLAMGYGGTHQDAGKAFGKGHDDGIDGIVKQDRLGLDAVYIQAKKWDATRKVGRPDVQAFAGSLEGQHAKKGVFITTASFSSEALDFVKRIRKKIVLVDGRLLADLMIDHNVGTTPERTFVIKKLDEDYFLEG